MFSPFWAVTKRNYRQVEGEFFRSLTHLCSRYEIAEPNVQSYSYPQNVAIAYREVEAAVKLKDKHANCIISWDEQHSATLAVLKSYDTGRCLYYIPVRPLWQLLKAAPEQPLTELLLSVFAYLYQVAKIPFYGEVGSYMSYQYETLQNWIDETDDDSEMEREYREEQQTELETLHLAGNRLITIIRDKACLDKLESNLHTYRHSVDATEAITAFAGEIVALYQEYPSSSLFDNIHDDLIEPEETERIRAEQYISFYWSSKDCFYDMLFDMVNNEFQECGITDEPMSIQFFDTPQTDFVNDLNFENRLFNLIDNLCELLDPYDHD
ncbi:hypothetical protein [Mucilaginibacter sp. UYCu711]|uniref:hypothetical protein n=1 Tax=Mucilaginibacter sp. UYCu711 TaxID=3156339 RepID=UPI003D1B4F69